MPGAGHGPMLAALLAGVLLMAFVEPADAPPGKPRSAAVGEPGPEAPTRAVPDLDAATYGARVMRRTQLRARPGGRVVATLGRRTRFGSEQVLAVVDRRGRWLGVLSEHRPNSRAGWIPSDAVELVHEPYAIAVDLSARRLVVRREGEVVRDARVAIGRPGTPTPTGRFAVTDALRLTGGGSPYGCCVLALSGRQPHIGQGWTGGDRLAVHGTADPASIGTAASLGCLRAGTRDMRWLIANIPLGTPVTVRG